MLSYGPGSYVLTPVDYGYSTNIVVEMWAGGASGNKCNGNGGASGSYIRFGIDTYENGPHPNEFKLIVGSGGVAVDDLCYATRYDWSSFKNITGGNGTSSMFLGEVTRIEAGPGIWRAANGDYISVATPNTIQCLDSTKIYNNTVGNDGPIVNRSNLAAPRGIAPCPVDNYGNLRCITWPISWTYWASPGADQYGGAGGRGQTISCACADSTSCQSVVDSQDGHTPAGGGGGSGYNNMFNDLYQYDAVCIQTDFGKARVGGDGLINVYFW